MEKIPFSASLRILHGQVSEMKPASEVIPTRSANGRVLAAPLFAWRSNPAEPLAAMDGIAVNSRQFRDVPVRLQPGEWQRINTGEPVHERFDAVVRIEDVEWEGETPVVERPAVPLQNVRRRGEDFHSGALLISSDTQLHPQDLSLLLAAGLEEIEVYRKPRVVFLPTGSELVRHASEQYRGKVLESNSAMIAGMVESWGGEFFLADPVADDRETLVSRFREWAAQCDVLIISAGTSMGSRDLTFEAIQELGKIHFHGVALHPAKPVILAEISGTPVLGLPGYPVAAFIASFIYLRPLILALSKIEWKAKQDVFISAEDIPAKDVDCFYRVCLYDVDGRIYAKRILRGAGSILSVSWMDGLMHVPPGIEIRKRDGVRVDILNQRWQSTFAVQGVRDSNVLRLFELFHQTRPAHRILFWDAPVKEALEAMIERNAHLAVIAGEEDSNPFPEYAAQLQEPMLQFRLFTRDSKIHYDLIALESHYELPAVQHLVDLASSSEFAQYIRSQEGCELPPPVVDRR